MLSDRKFHTVWKIHDFSITHTGCPGSNFPISKSFYSESVHVRPQLGKAKIGLRMEQFFGQILIFENLEKNTTF